MMHIPNCETNELELQCFEEALKCSQMPNDTYDVDKWLYVPNEYTEYRYLLGTKGKNPLICIGINPSTAKPDALDNTLKSVERIAHHNGFDSFIMLNVYPQRATNPDDMEKSFNFELHAENLKAFDYALSLCKVGNAHVWLGCGNIIEKRDFLAKCLIDMKRISDKYNANWYSCGKVSVKGHPHHPLYLKKDSPLDLFDIDKYVDKLLK